MHEFWNLSPRLILIIGEWPQSADSCCLLISLWIAQFSGPIHPLPGICVGSRWADVQRVQHPQDAFNPSICQTEYMRKTKPNLFGTAQPYLLLRDEMRSVQVTFEYLTEYASFPAQPCSHCSVMSLQPVRPRFQDCSISPRRSDMNITPLSHSSFVTLRCSNIWSGFIS